MMEASGRTAPVFEPLRSMGSESPAMDQQLEERCDKTFWLLSGLMLVRGEWGDERVSHCKGVLCDGVVCGNSLLLVPSGPLLV